MTNKQKTIVLVAAILIVAAILYPPFYSNYSKGEWTYAGSGWMFIGKLVKDYPRYFPKVRFDILGLEILGILVLAGAALLISKKR